MTGRSVFRVAIFILGLGLTACAPTPLPVNPIQTSMPTLIIQPVASPGADLPQTEAEVPRVSPAGAKAALDSGEAIIVDVRSTDAYAASHIKGAISISLDRLEAAPASFNLKKDQWIITYCT